MPVLILALLSALLSLFDRRQQGQVTMRSSELALTAQAPFALLAALASFRVSSPLAEIASEKRKDSAGEVPNSPALGELAVVHRDLRIAAVRYPGRGWGQG